MSLVRRTVEAGRLARQKAGIKLRQPLEEAVIAAGEDGMWVLRRYERMIADELNVKRVECIESRKSMIEYALAPNLKSLGPRLKESAADVTALMEKVDGGQMARHLASSGRIRIGGFDIFEEDVITDKVHLRTHTTFYTKYGNVFSYFVSVVTIFAVLSALYHKYILKVR